MSDMLLLTIMITLLVLYAIDILMRTCGFISANRASTVGYRFKNKSIGSGDLDISLLEQSQRLC